MKTLSEKEFNGLNIKAMFTEKVEQAKKKNCLHSCRR